MLAHALAYAARGWPVFPQDGKRPMIRRREGGSGVHDATLDEGLIREWWRRWPRANIGLACGVAGWWALDVDGDLGAVTMSGLTAGRKWPATVSSRSGGGGWHLMFRVPAGVQLRNWSGGQCEAWPHIGVDIRAHGASITAPPSIHPVTGRAYRWLSRHGPDDLPIADPPRWLVELAAPPPLPPIAPHVEPIEGEWGPKPAYSRAALACACECIREALPGSQDATLNGEAFMIGQLIGSGLMPLDVARSHLVAAGMEMQAGNPRWPWREAEIRRKVDRALTDGQRRPRVPAEGRHQKSH